MEQSLQSRARVEGREYRYFSKQNTAFTLFTPQAVHVRNEKVERQKEFDKQNG